MHRQPIKYFDGLLDDCSREDRIQNVPQRPQLARVGCVTHCHMANREAILRLSINTGDTRAITWLHSNSGDVVGGTIPCASGAAHVAEKAEGLLMQRMANQARSYELQE